MWVLTHSVPIEKIRWDKQDVVTCDERGRATLGSEYANEQVFVWIAETPEPDELGERPDKETRVVLSKMIQWANDEGITAFDLDSESGVITDKKGDNYQSPYSTEDES